MNKCNSPIAIDLGAKNKWVVFTHCIEGTEPIYHKDFTLVFLNLFEKR